MANIGVVGAGLMGGEIALVFALAQHNVLLTDRNQSTIDKAIERLLMILEKGVARGFYAENQVTPTMSRISTTLDLEDFADREVVTEAVFEDIEVKAETLTKLQSICTDDCIIASNTSTIPISTLAGYLTEQSRRRFIGTHHFSPVSRMKLVEVVSGFDTSDETFNQTMTLMESIGKTPIKVKDVAGFAVNRVLHMFIIEAVKLVEEGVATPEDIDTACRLGLGHPIGPFALLDVVTSSLSVQAQEIMQEAYGERFRPPPLLKQMVRAGYGGGKGKPGWISQFSKDEK